MPEEYATAVPPSSAPMACSRAVVLGACSRAYSMSPPAWNDDAGTMGALRGWPGSAGGRPALTARVASDGVGPVGVWSGTRTTLARRVPLAD